MSELRAGSCNDEERKKRGGNMAAVMNVIPSNHADKRVHVFVEYVCMWLCRSEQSEGR